MGYYLKKHWKINLLIAILQILWAGVRVLNNVVSMQVGQGLFALDLTRFLFWAAVNLLLWWTASALNVARTRAKSKAKMDMNNHVRADMVASILKKSHQEYHAQQSGEYLSQFTNDVNQIAGFAWNSFYDMISLGAQVVFSIAALTQLHWSLLVVSAIDALIIFYLPKLFEKKVESLSEVCAAEQAKAMSKMKDLLSGLDVLRFFGRTDRFMKGNQAASEQMERPKYRQAYIQNYVNEGINMVNTTLQCLISVLIGILSIKGVILQAALIGGGNQTIVNGSQAAGDGWRLFSELACAAGKLTGTRLQLVSPFSQLAGAVDALSQAVLQLASTGLELPGTAGQAAGAVSQLSCAADAAGQTVSQLAGTRVNLAGTGVDLAGAGVDLLSPADQSARAGVKAGCTSVQLAGTSVEADCTSIQLASTRVKAVCTGVQLAGTVVKAVCASVQLACPIVKADHTSICLAGTVVKAVCTGINLADAVVK